MEKQRLEGQFQKFLKQKYSSMNKPKDGKFVKALRDAYKEGALAGVDLFLEFYNQYKEEPEDE